MTSISADRAYWVEVADRIARPVLEALRDRRLRAIMPVESRQGQDRSDCTYLEALGRLLCGLAPWLELGEDGTEEGRLRAELASLAREAIDAGTDPASPDFMNFSRGGQPIVDAAFLAQAVLRASTELWAKLPPRVQQNLVECLAATRTRKPAFNNWLLFGATIEAALCRMGKSWDKMRVDYAIHQHAQWYLGDGVYGDGPHFHWDYYNSFVIQPMLLDTLAAVENEDQNWGMTRAVALQRSRRWAAVQERLISPEGTFPPLGRSLAYRFGALQSLAQMALLHELPKEILPAQARCAMTAVIRRMAEAPGTFDSQGWLTIGFCGHQPNLGETYISTGSLYLCSAGLLPLGLPPSDSFWTDPAAPWTSQKLWAGMDAAADHAISQ